MKNVKRLAALITIASAISTTALATQGVSPGATDRLAQVNDPCPTFSWSDGEGVARFEIVAYALSEDPAQASELTAENEMLFAAVPAGATSWTPSADQCFAPGGRYVWFVRAVTELAGDQVIEARDWSEARYFTVPAGPTQDEVARAVEVLKRWDAANRSVSPIISSGTGMGMGTRTSPDAGSGSSHPKSVLTGSAAIRGEHPSMTGEAYGVVGISESYTGAGVAAANQNGGPDLVLDGSVDGEPDARLWEWGLDRASATDWSFRFGNSGAGDMTLEVAGTLKATEIDCPDCVTSAIVANGSIATADLAAGAVTNTKIAAGSVYENHIVPYAVTSGKIDDYAVTASKLGPGSVTTSKIANSAVVSASIADGAIGPPDVGFNYAGSSSKGGPAANVSCTACVSATELDATGGATGQVLKHNGSTVTWAEDVGGALTLPWSGGATSTGPSFYVGNSGTGWGVHVEAAINNAIVGDAIANGSGVLGRNMTTSGSGVGVTGTTRSNAGVGVSGWGDPAAPTATGVKGESVSGTGVLGVTDRTVAIRGEVGWGIGVRGVSNGPDTVNGYPGAGVYGTVTGPGAGVYGSAGTTGQYGVYGERGASWGGIGTFYAAVRGSGWAGDTGVLGSSASGYGVEGTSDGSGTTGSAVRADNGNYSGIALYATNSSVEATILGRNNGTGDLLRLNQSSNIRFRVEGDGDVLADGTFQPGGADFAELLPAFSDDLEPGDVLAIAADGRLMRSQQAYQASVVGVYSTKPGILGGLGIDGDTAGKVPLAVVGVVPVKTCDQNGPVRPGDMLVASSIPGHAMRAGERVPNGRVIGKALSGLEEGEGEITMLVILQ